MTLCLLTSIGRMVAKLLLVESVVVYRLFLVRLVLDLAWLGNGPSLVLATLWGARSSAHRKAYVAAGGISLQEANAWFKKVDWKPSQGYLVQHRSLDRWTAAHKKKKGVVSKHSVKKAWKHDVVEDGDVHPHPGPDFTVRTFNVVCLNVGGAPGTWKAMDAWISTKRVAVLALQESAFCLKMRSFRSGGVPSKLATAFIM